MIYRCHFISHVNGRSEGRLALWGMPVNFSLCYNSRSIKLQTKVLQDTEKLTVPQESTVQ